MTFKKLLFSFSAIFIVLSAWNLMQWSAFKDIVVEIKPSTSRIPASIEDPVIYKKQMKSEHVVFDCKIGPKDIRTEHAYVRFTFTNCQTEPKFINASNKFHASLWSKGKGWISDYIPLEENENLFKLDENISIKVTRKAAHDAAKSQ